MDSGRPACSDALRRGRNSSRFILTERQALGKYLGKQDKTGRPPNEHYYLTRFPNIRFAAANHLLAGRSQTRIGRPIRVQQTTFLPIAWRNVSC